MAKGMIGNLLKLKPSIGLVLLLASLAGIIIDNSPLTFYYHHILAIPLPLSISSFGIFKSLDLRAWINDALMAVFFLLVGLELKKEMIEGELSSPSKITLPVIAAIGGVIVPALIYFAFNFNEKINLRGWAIPTATDIAFAIGILNLFKNRVSKSLRIFLLSLAIIDDLIAILIIAFFYSSDVELVYLSYAFLITLILFAINKYKISITLPYLLVGCLLWMMILKSGIHPTIAGVILAFSIPLKLKNRNSASPLKSLEHKLQFPVNYLILPLFAFANIGMNLSNFSFNFLNDPIVLGIAFGLFFGKQIGIFLAVLLMVKLKICQFFKNSSWLEFYGVCILAGVGFTMSLFIGNLAFFDHETLLDELRAGVLIGSLLSAVAGILIIKTALKNKNG